MPIFGSPGGLGTYTPYVPKVAPAAMSANNPNVLPSSKLRESVNRQTREESERPPAPKGQPPKVDAPAENGAEGGGLPVDFFHPTFVQAFGPVLFGCKVNDRARWPTGTSLSPHVCRP